ncbi:hypothetical protein H2200_006819 [Cladophialophora chaetospira]|uniref:Zn(2)-C6 fungal-type domain-containing protein n=1 Tax=Cladophialophora chaetospira TaxID=386627 RepID=A0AA38X8X8_9EURO|nr:hypothetical protein H2200_006819 [Cladophialophora chaetospira]
MASQDQNTPCLRCGATGLCFHKNTRIIYQAQGTKGPMFERDDDFDLSEQTRRDTQEWYNRVRVPTPQPVGGSGTSTPTNPPTSPPVNPPTNMPTNMPTNLPANFPVNPPTNPPANMPPRPPLQNWGPTMHRCRRCIEQKRRCTGPPRCTICANMRLQPVRCEFPDSPKNVDMLAAYIANGGTMREGSATRPPGWSAQGGSGSGSLSSA